VFNFIRYKTVNGKVDFDALRKIAHEKKPKIILA
jgi:glycine/serine hydroxymethyltransferase